MASLPAAVLGVLALALLVTVGVLYRNLRGLRAQYAAVPDAVAEAARLKDEAAQAIARQKSEAARELERLTRETARLRTNEETAAAAAKSRREALDAEYTKAKSLYDRLRSELLKVEENLEDISFGLYKPHFAFDTPDEYKQRLEETRDKQKTMVRSGDAIRIAVTWTVGNSRRDGERMQKQYSKLLLRAFNGECDAAVAKVSWNNVSKMEERIEKAFEAMNELGGVMQITITRPYLELKLAELRLEYEFEEKKRQVVEEQRRIKEQMREEERAQRELEQAQEEAQAEETRFQRAVERARLELAKTSGEEHARLNAKLVELQTQLEEAHRKKEHATSLAQLTKAGYVYVISNIGSFGDDVFKIGMTRRLDPMDRVKELGDASVPFSFDVHAMVYSENAPALEYELQQYLESKSVNLVNLRKEFFHVTIPELEALAVEKGLKVSFTKLAEAREYRETLSLRAGASRPAPRQPASTFPETLSEAAVA